MTTHISRYVSRALFRGPWQGIQFLGCCMNCIRALKGQSSDEIEHSTRSSISEDNASSLLRSSTLPESPYFGYLIRQISQSLKRHLKAMIECPLEVRVQHVY